MNELATVSFRRLGPVTVATLEGEIDLSNAAAIRESLLGECAYAPVTMLDLSGLGYADSAGVGTVLSLSRALDSLGHDLYVVAPPGSAAATLLALAPLAGVTVVESADEALAAVTTDPPQA